MFGPRVTLVLSVGIRESVINRAEGLRQSKILASEAVRIEQINQAKGEASAILARATARAQALLTLGKAIGAKVRMTISHKPLHTCIYIANIRTM